MSEDQEVDGTTMNAIAEETSGKPATEVTEIEEQAQDTPEVESVQKKADGPIGDFQEPDYADVLSERDRSEDVDEDVETRPLDPVEQVAVPEPVAAVVAPAVPAPPAPQSNVGKPEELPVIPTAATTPGEKLTPEQEAEAIQKLQQDVLGELSKLYQFSAEDAANVDDLEKRPSEYLPGLLAKAHQNAYAHAYQAVMTALPSMVNQISSTNVKQQQYENAFLQRWPELKGQDEISIKAIKTIRQMNPNATVEEAIERGGMLAMISLGKAPQASQPTAPPPEPALTPPRPVQPGGSGGLTPVGPRTYEEKVFDEILRDERNFARG